MSEFQILKCVCTVLISFTLQHLEYCITHTKIQSCLYLKTLLCIRSHLLKQLIDMNLHLAFFQQKFNFYWGCLHNSSYSEIPLFQSLYHKNIEIHIRIRSTWLTKLVIEIAFSTAYKFKCKESFMNKHARNKEIGGFKFFFQI